MIQNLKVDIIYYSTGTDFEMEFNLCGCCRMRLLTDKVNDKKGLVNSLARAVSRSRVMIACGPLFGNNGLIEITSGAIGRKLISADNDAFGINSDEIISIIDGSTPLVTPEGYFGGCIIESGPQTIILLSENKTIRKSLMKNLIHPYIEELTVSGINAQPSEEIQPDEPENPDIEEEIPQTENEEMLQEEPADEAQSTDELTENPEASEEETETNNAEQTEEVTEMKPEKNSVEYTEKTNVNIPPQDVIPDEIPLDDIFFVEENEMYIEPEHVKFDGNSHYEKDFTPSTEDEQFLTENDNISFTQMQKNERNIDIALIIASVGLALILAILGYLLIYLPHKNGIDTTTYLRNAFGIAKCFMNLKL